MDIANRRAEEIVGKLAYLIRQAEELKIEEGRESQAFHISCGQEKLAKFLNNRQEEIDEGMERKRFEAKQEQQQEEESRLTELHLRQEEHERDRRKLMHNYRRRING